MKNLKLVLCALVFPLSSAFGAPTIDGIPDSELPTSGLDSVNSARFQVKMARERAMADLQKAYEVSKDPKIKKALQIVSEYPLFIEVTHAQCTENVGGFVPAVTFNFGTEAVVLSMKPEIHVCLTGVVTDKRSTAHIITHEAFHLALATQDDCYAEAYTAFAAVETGDPYAAWETERFPYWQECELSSETAWRQLRAIEAEMAAELAERRDSDQK